MVTTGAAVKVTTGTALKTMLQIKASASNALRICAWGVSFDGSALATPGVVELIETGAVGATVTAYVAADIYPHNDPNAPASLIQIGSVTNSGFTSSGEGSVVATRMLDVQLVDPAVGYMQQFPLGREPEIKAGNYCRIRVTFGSAINCLCWIVWEE
jgi:hypothetical protein